MLYLQNLWQLSLEAAPWLLLGLLIAGLLKAWIPDAFMHRHLGGNGYRPVVKAALLGAPLPLCSCGVIPAALGLRRAGASKPATVSFLVSTPETGVDSVSMTYAMMGPVMAITRPIVAISSALLSGFLVEKFAPSASAMTSNPAHSHDDDNHSPAIASCCAPAPGSGCCSSASAEPAEHMHKSGAHHDDCCGSTRAPAVPVESRLARARAGISYTFSALYNDILLWLIVGILFAAAVQTFVPPSFLAQWGQGLPAMIVMILAGIPMYVCATASTPIAAGLMLAGVSPGTALVFLMAGPATNIGSLGIIGKELGKNALIAYLAGVIITAVAAGLILDGLSAAMGWDITTQLSHAHDMLPFWLSLASLLVLVGAAIWPKPNTAGAAATNADSCCG